MTSLTGMSSDELQELRQKYVAPGVFQLTEIAIDRAKGAKVWDVEGREYIDFVGGIGCVNAGHNPDSVVEAIQKQLSQYIHPSINVLNYQPYIDVAKKLCELTPGDFDKQAVLFNSGAEAVENAVKIARYDTCRDAILCFEGGFHGRTLLGMSLTSKTTPYKNGYGPFAPEIYHIPHPAMDNITDYDNYFQHIFSTIVSATDVAAIIFEPVLGEGGFIPMPKPFVQHLRQVCDKHNIVMIADEIQTGFCRTGQLFAMNHFDVSPDLMTVGKSIASGMPLTAVVGKKELVSASHAGGIGGTFCGNPLACAASLASLEMYENHNLSQRAMAIGEQVIHFFNGIKDKYHCIGDIHGLGAMIGIAFIDKHGKADAALLKSIMAKSLSQGVILMSAGVKGNILRTLMPLVISDEELNQAFAGMAKAIAQHFN